MNYVFGPVPSRRLGQSLGVDTIPLKTCNWNCVYCQLGRTIPLINERKEYYPTLDILAEVKNAITSHKAGEINWITFVGSGEPTLHSKIGWLIREIKKFTDLPVAVITNGALLYLAELREELLAADAVLPSFDAGSPELYRKINRPHPDINYERFLQGLIDFRKVYQGKLWIEVMLVSGLNDTDDALHEIAVGLEQIKPDEIHINLPTRPPVETWVKPADEKRLKAAIKIFGKHAHVVHPVNGTFDVQGDNLVDAIINIIQRHPMKQEEIEKTLTYWAPIKVGDALAELKASGRAQVVERYGTKFWSASPSYYPDKQKSEKVRPKLVSNDSEEN